MRCENATSKKTKNSLTLKRQVVMIRKSLLSESCKKMIFEN